MYFIIVVGRHINAVEKLTRAALESATEYLSAHGGDRITLRIREPNVSEMNFTEQPVLFLYLQLDWNWSVKSKGVVCMIYNIKHGIIESLN